MRSIPIKAFAIFVLLFSATALVACGESAEDKAKTEVCDAHNEINSQIAKLESLTLSTNTPNEVKASAEAIGKSLTKIKNAASKLAPARREQVEAGVKQLESEASKIASELTSNLTAANLEATLTKLKSSVSTFGANFKKALAPVGCT
jgi:vacuolar-type H+-ATPase subunit H